MTEYKHVRTVYSGLSGAARLQTQTKSCMVWPLRLCMCLILLRRASKSACMKYCCYSALTESATKDWHVFAVTTIMLAPATMSAFSQWRLVASTVHIVHPDSTWASAVVVANTHTVSPTQTTSRSLHGKDLHGDSDHGTAGMEASIAEFPRDGNKCSGTPTGMDNILWDSRGNVWLYLTFMVHLHQQVNPTSITFTCKTFGACFNYSDNANWNISVGCWKFLLTNKQFCGNGWGWNDFFFRGDGLGWNGSAAGMGGDRTEIGRGWAGIEITSAGTCGGRCNSVVVQVFTSRHCCCSN